MKVQKNATQSRAGNKTKAKSSLRKSIAKWYGSMFFALTRAHLLQGKTLGKAWHDAIKQMESFIQTKDAMNPIVQKLQGLVKRHRKKLAKKMMTPPNRNKVIRITPELRAKILAKNSERMRFGQNGLNQIIAKYQPVAVQRRAELARLLSQRGNVVMPVKKDEKTVNSVLAQKQLSNAEQQKLVMEIYRLQMQRQHTR